MRRISIIGKILIAGSFFLLILIIGLWYIAIPEGLIKERIEESFLSSGIKVEAEGLEKGFFSLTIDRMLLTGKDTPSLVHPFIISNLEARFDFPSLLGLDPSIIINAPFAGGSLKGNYSPFRNLLSLTIDNSKIEEMGFISGIDGKGIISGNGFIYLKESRGAFRFNITNVSIKDITDKGFVPLSLFNAVRGFIEFDRDAMRIPSLSLEGKGIYGRIRDARFISRDFRFLDGLMEIMVNSDFPMPQLIELGLLRYRKAPGYYLIPLRS